MIKVLIVASAAPAEPGTLLDTLAKLRSRGVETSLACFGATDDIPVDGALAEMHSFGVAPYAMAGRWARAVKRSPAAQRPWLHARRDGWLRARARQADVIVANDAGAVHVVWQLAQRHPYADAVFGLVPALRAVDRRIAGHRVSTARAVQRRATSLATANVSAAHRFGIRAIKGVLRRATGRKVMRTAPGAWLWRTAVVAPRLPRRVRTRLAVRVHRGLVMAGRDAAAISTTEAAIRRTGSEEARANLLGGAVAEEFRLGRRSALLEDAVSAWLALADAQVGRDPGAVARYLTRATSLLFHRVLHFDGLASPIADDPAALLAPLRNSAAVQRMAAPRGRLHPAAPPPTDRPQRLLLVTRNNHNFLGEIREHYTRHPDVEVRVLDLNADPSRHRVLQQAGSALIADVLAGGTRYGLDVEEWLRPYLDWADTVFIDWCQSPAALFTLIDPGTTRIIVRLHSFEAFTVWPHLVDFSRIDDMVFVSEHLRDLTVAIYPRLAGPAAPRLRVISNAMDLKRYQRGDKADATRFTLGLVGVSQIAKDPRWAIEVLRLLREEDPRYRLMMIGSKLRPSTSAAARAYYSELRRDFQELVPEGAIVTVGHTDDVPGVLEEVGVILSTSVRESFHCALVEGAASGAVPVVRDWPFFARMPNGPRTLFPAGWTVDSPEQAAKRVLAVTGTEAAWREEGAAAAAHAISTWDWSVTKHLFDDMIGVRSPS